MNLGEDTIQLIPCIMSLPFALHCAEFRGHTLTRKAISTLPELGGKTEIKGKKLHSRQRDQHCNRALGEAMGNHRRSPGLALKTGEACSPRRSRG